MSIMVIPGPLEMTSLEIACLGIVWLIKGKGNLLGVSENNFFSLLENTAYEKQHPPLAAGHLHNMSEM